MRKIIGFLILSLPAFGAYTGVREIKVPADRVHNSDLTNFPVMVEGTYPYFATVPNGGGVTNPNGYDIVFASDPACTNLLKFTRIVWSADGKGPSQFQVQIPTLSHLVDNVFYACYGNSAITTDQQSKLTYDSTYLGMWHFGDGVTLDLHDATANGNDGTTTSARAGAGELGGGALFTGGSGIIVPHNSSLISPTTGLTISAWVNSSNLNQGSVTALVTQTFNQPNSSPWWSYYLSVSDPGCQPWDGFPSGNITGDANTFGVGFTTTQNNSALQVLCSDPVNQSRSVPGRWYHVVFTYDGSLAKVFVNGQQTSQRAVTGPLVYGTGNFGIGSDGAGNDGFQGAIDEVYVANVARSSDWIQAEEDNGRRPDEFYSIGPVLTNSSQITNVSVDATTTQAIITFTAPSNPAACTLAVSESPSMSPLVNDANPALFANAQYANRDSANQIFGNTVRFVSGKRFKAYYADAAGADTSIRWSRALQASTGHYFVINCGGAEYDGNFVTNTLPFGDNHVDSIPPDPTRPGEAMWQTWIPNTRCNTDDSGCFMRGEQRRLFKTTDVQTGVLMEPLVLPGDSAFYSGINTFWFPKWSGSDWTVGANYVTGADVATTTAATPLVHVGSSVVGFAGFNNPGYTVPNWIKFAVQASIGNSACDGSNTADACKIEFCLELDQVNCAANAQVYEVVVSNALKPYSIGSGQPFDVLQKPGKRAWTRDEIASRTLGATCSGADVTIPWNGDDFVAGVQVNPGTRVLINGTGFNVTSLANGLHLSLDGTPSTCSNITIPGFSIAVWKKVANGDTLTLSQPTYANTSTGDSLPQVYSGTIAALSAVNLPNGHKATMIKPNQGMYAVDLQNGDVYPSQSTTGGQGSPPASAATGSVNIDSKGSLWTFFNDSSLQVTTYEGDFTAPYMRGGNNTQWMVPLWESNGGVALPNCDHTATPPINNHCINLTPYTKSGTSISDLLKQFDSKFPGDPFTTRLFDGIEAGDVLSLDLRWAGSEGQAYYGWHVLFNPYTDTNVNGQYGAGCIANGITDSSDPFYHHLGCIVAARRTWGTPGARWAFDKGSIPLAMLSLSADQTTLVGAQNKPGSGYEISGVVGGAFSDITCPSDAPTLLGTTVPPTSTKTTACVTLTVDGNPYDQPSDSTGTGGTRAILGPWMAGDYAVLGDTAGNTQLGGGTAWQFCGSFYAGGGCDMTNVELMEVVSVGTVGGDGSYTLTLACINANKCPTTGSGQPSSALWAWGNYPGTYVPWSIQTPIRMSNTIYWDYVDDPHGVNPITADYSSNNSHAFGIAQTLSYATQLGDSYSPVPHYMNRDYHQLSVSDFLAKIGDKTNTPQVDSVTPTLGLFEGVSPANGRIYNSHPNYANYPPRDGSPAFGVDGITTGGSDSFPMPSQIHLVSGATSLYYIDAGVLTGSGDFHPKIFDTQVTSGPRIVRNISAPGSLMVDGSGGYYTFCYVSIAGECWNGSTIGQFYFNIPYFVGGVTVENTLGSACMSDAYQVATGTNDVWQPNDLCITDAGLFSSHSRYNLHGMDHYGWGRQSLGHNLIQAKSDIFTNIEGINIFPNTDQPQWYYTTIQYLDGGYFGTILMKGPTPTTDSTIFARPNYGEADVSFHVPAGVDGVGVEIAYEGYGWFCSPNRAEACVSVSGAGIDSVNPFWWEQTENPSYTPLSCSGTALCTVVAPVLWNRVARLTPVGYSGKNIVWRGTPRLVTAK